MTPAATFPLESIALPALVGALELLADATRLCILRELAERGPLSVTALADAVGASQPSTSHHLRLLLLGGVVTATKRGRCVDYALSEATRALGRQPIVIGPVTLTLKLARPKKGTP